jgi:hypothetical protein
MEKQLTDTEIISEIKLEIEGFKKETEATTASKNNFIKEIKSGLGSEIKQKGGRVMVVKKTKFQKMTDWLKKIFTKF